MISKKYTLSCKKAIKHGEHILYSLGARNIKVDCSNTGRRYPDFFLNYRVTFLKEEDLGPSTPPVERAAWTDVEGRFDGMCGFYTALLKSASEHLPIRNLAIQSDCKGELGSLSWSALALLPAP